MNDKRALKILIVDDESHYQDVFKMILEEEGFIIDTAGSAQEAITILKDIRYDLILTDLVMPDMDGIALLCHVKSHYKDTDVIIVTGYGTVQNAVEAMKKGAYTYFIKSHDPEELILEIRKLEKIVDLEQDNSVLRSQQEHSDTLLVTNSRTFQSVIDMAEKAARSNSNILLLGESGVGKEVFANHIHKSSDRHNRLFIPVNCHALADNLIESELFGHEKGAFTGADEQRKGKFEIAHGSTLFLDEIGEVSMSSQVKLLRTLENRMIERVGGNKQINVDFRLICATNRDLRHAVEAGNFREDLFYRISTISIEIPPLRERREDLPDLIDYFLRRIEREQKKPVCVMEPSVRKALLAYDYPGNVRELKNIIERMVVLSDDGKISETFLPQLHKQGGNRTQRSLRDVRKESEKRYIREVLDLCSGNITRAAEILEMSRRQLFNKIQEYGIKTGN